jgi:hypothetical protein
MFIRDNRDEDLPYPLPGLTLRFLSDNGKIKMWVEVKDTPSFSEAVKKNRRCLNLWRGRLTAFEARPYWETLPPAAHIIIALSKKGEACRHWLKKEDSSYADWLSGEGEGLTPGAIAKKINQVIEGFLSRDEPVTRLPTPDTHIYDGFHDACDWLRVVGLTKEEAGVECDELLRDIRLKNNPFTIGRSKYCRPVTTEMIRKRLDSWTS